MNGMSCTRCGKPVNAVSAFCPHCGQPLRPAAPQATTTANATLATTALQQAYEDQKKRNVTIGIAAGVVVALVAVFLALKASGALGVSGSSPNDKILAAKGSTPGNMLTKLGDTGTPVMQQAAQKPEDIKMPQDVYDWLKHLEKCEAMKIELEGQQVVELQLVMQKMQVLGAGMGLMDPYDQSHGGDDDKDPGSFAAGKMQDLRPKWNELIAFYRSKQPPAECQPIADDFDRALAEIPAQTGDLSDIMNSVMTDPQNAMEKVQRMKNKSYASIDRYFLSCDRRLGDICMKYKVNKWFNIKADIDSGSLGKFGGFTGFGG